MNRQLTDSTKQHIKSQTDPLKNSAAKTPSKPSSVPSRPEETGQTIGYDSTTQIQLRNHINVQISLLFNRHKISMKGRPRPFTTGELPML